MDVPSHTEVVEQIDAFLKRHEMAPSRLGRDALGEASFVSDVRAGRQPRLSILAKLLDFMRERDERLATAPHGAGGSGSSHRLSAEAR